MKFFFNALLDFVGAFDRACEHELNAQVEQENEADRLHGRLNDALIKKRGKPGERQRAIDHFHEHSAHTNHQGPSQSAPRSLVDDRDIHRPHRNRNNEPAHKTR